MRIARDAYPYILFLLPVGCALCAGGYFWIGGVFIVLGLFIVFFFRDPERTFADDGHKVASPADGKIVSIRKEGDQDVLSIFLSVFNVHVNRAPVAGIVSQIRYIPGKFLGAFYDKASTDNERNVITIRRGDGSQITFVQIAGLIARRIVCWKKEGEKLTAGERVGLIKFGSRVDVYFPPGARIQVQLGQKVKAGETVIGEIP